MPEYAGCRSSRSFMFELPGGKVSDGNCPATGATLRGGRLSPPSRTTIAGASARLGAAAGSLGRGALAAALNPFRAAFSAGKPPASASAGLPVRSRVVQCGGGRGAVRRVRVGSGGGGGGCDAAGGGSNSGVIAGRNCRCRGFSSGRAGAAAAAGIGIGEGWIAGCNKERVGRRWGRGGGRGAASQSPSCSGVRPAAEACECLKSM